MVRLPYEIRNRVPCLLLPRALWLLPAKLSLTPESRSSGQWTSPWNTRCCHQSVDSILDHSKLVQQKSPACGQAAPGSLCCDSPSVGQCLVSIHESCCLGRGRRSSSVFLLKGYIFCSIRGLHMCTTCVVLCFFFLIIFSEQVRIWSFTAWKSEKISAGVYHATLFFSKEENALLFPLRNTILYISFSKSLFFVAWDSPSCVIEEKDVLNSCCFSQTPWLLCSKELHILDTCIYCSFQPYWYLF